MTSTFDPALLLQETTEQVSERRDPLPVADYTALICEPKVKTGVKDDKPWTAVDIPLEIVIPPEVAQRLGYDKLTVRGGGLLDLTDGGSIDWGKGKNTTLRNFREALDMNKVGDRFSIAMMQGRLVKVKITHDLYQGNIVEKVGGVAKA